MALPPVITSPRLITPLLLVIGLGALVIGLAVNASLLFNLLAPSAVSFPEAFAVLTPDGVVHQGDTLVLRVTRCAWNITGDAPIPSDTTRELVNATSPAIVVLPSTRVDIPPGCHTVESRLSLIPADLPPGRWLFRGATTARGKTVPWSTQPFDVTP